MLFFIAKRRLSCKRMYYDFTISLQEQEKIQQECNIFFKVLALVALATHPFQYSIMKAKRLHYYAY